MKKLPQNSVVLRGLRGREDMTQKDLAKKLRTSPSTISRMETGKRKIDNTKATELVAILKTRPKMFEQD